MAKKQKVFVREFEGLEVLQELLDLAGAQLDAQGVVQRFREAQARGEAAQRVVPTLFEQEPRFPDPEYARMLYQNLLGLWDVLEAGEDIEPVRRERPARVKKPKAEAPPPFPPEGPDEEWLTGALRYLQDVDERGMDRLVHAFENRQDALLQYLEERGFSEDAWGTARSLFFELFAFLELGWPAGVRSVSAADLDAAERTSRDVPAALQAYADEVVAEAETDDEQPLQPEEAGQLKTLVRRALKALWMARKVER
ncbi:MAG: hypothetical protein ACJ790_04055 [Myxococcaceae bacterium]